MKRIKKHPGRKRRIGGWALIAIAVAVAGGWMASGWKGLGFSSHSYAILCSSGRLLWVDQVPEASITKWVTFPVEQPPSLRWRVDEFPRRAQVPAWVNGLVNWTSHNDGSPALVFICFWPLPLLLTAAGVPLLLSGRRARRRAVAGACMQCGYDRRGLAAGAVCPECGGT